MGCGEHWPRCNGEWFPPLDLPTLIEISHRWAAARGERAGPGGRGGGGATAPGRARAPQPGPAGGLDPGGPGPPRRRHGQAGPPSVGRHHPLRQRHAAPGRAAGDRAARLRPGQPGTAEGAAAPLARPGAGRRGAGVRGDSLRRPGGQFRRRPPLPRLSALQRQRAAAGGRPGGAALDPSGAGLRVPGAARRAGCAAQAGYRTPVRHRFGCGPGWRWGRRCCRSGWRRRWCSASCPPDCEPCTCWWARRSGRPSSS